MRWISLPSPDIITLVAALAAPQGGKAPQQREHVSGKADKHSTCEFSESAAEDGTNLRPQGVFSHYISCRDAVWSGDTLMQVVPCSTSTIGLG